MLKAIKTETKTDSESKIKIGMETQMGALMGMETQTEIQMGVETEIKIRIPTIRRRKGNGTDRVALLVNLYLFLPLRTTE